MSYTELGPPDSTMPTGSCARISSSVAVHGRIAENTCCSRMRRAISCVYCPPKSRTTIPCRVLTVPPALLLRCGSGIRRSSVSSNSDSSQNNIYELLGHDNGFTRFPCRQSAAAMRGSFSARFRVSSSLRSSSTRIFPRRRPLIWMMTSNCSSRVRSSRYCGHFSRARLVSMPQHLPQLFRDVRRHRRKHQQQHFQSPLQNHRAKLDVQRFLRMKIVHQLHHQRDGGIEVPAHLEIVGDALQRLMRLAHQQLFLRRRIAQIRLLRQVGLNARAAARRGRSPAGKPVSEIARSLRLPASLHSRSFSGGAANSVYMRPVSQPYLSAISIAPTTLPRDFDIATPPFCTMPCVNRRVIGSS